jgi:uncharacterized membrane protein
MELRIDKFVWVLAVSLCTIVTAFLFIPALANFYFSFGRYFIYLGLFVGLYAIALIWYRSYKLGGWRNHGMAAIKTIVFVAVFSVAFVILIASHSGI